MQSVEGTALRHHRDPDGIASLRRRGGIGPDKCNPLPGLRPMMHMFRATRSIDALDVCPALNTLGGRRAHVRVLSPPLNEPGRPR